MSNPLQNEEMFFENLYVNLKKPIQDIILFDYDNEHGETMVNLIKNQRYPLSLHLLHVKWYKIEDLEDFSKKLHDLDPQKNEVICIPFSWEMSNHPVITDIVETLYSLSRYKPIIVVGGDENFNKNLSFCIIADKQLEWETGFKNQTITISGECAYAAFLSILALKGFDYILETKSTLDKII